MSVSSRRVSMSFLSVSSKKLFEVQKGKIIHNFTKKAKTKVKKQIRFCEDDPSDLPADPLEGPDPYVEPHWPKLANSI